MLQHVVFQAQLQPHDFFTHHRFGSNFWDNPTLIRARRNPKDASIALAYYMRSFLGRILQCLWQLELFSFVVHCRQRAEMSPSVNGAVARVRPGRDRTVRVQLLCGAAKDGRRPSEVAHQASATAAASLAAAAASLAAGVRRHPSRRRPMGPALSTLVACGGLAQTNQTIPRGRMCQ